MPITITIEGNIGVGKTTFLDTLKQCDELKNSMEFIAEPVNIWLATKDSNGDNVLDKFYKELSDKQNASDYESVDHGWTYKFQTFTYITKMTNIVNALYHSDKKYIFLDRSIGTDKYVFEKMLYDDKMLSLLEHNMYLTWSNFYDKYIAKTNKKHIIYLYCDPEIAYNRIQKRGRLEEKNITIEYLRKLHQYHEDWMKEELKNGSHVMILDWNSDLDQKQLDELVKTKIITFVNEISL